MEDSPTGLELPFFDAQLLHGIAVNDVDVATASSRLAESLVITAEKRLLDRVVAMASKQPDLSPDPKESETQGSFQPAKETKKTPLDPNHSERFALIGTTLDSK